MCHQINTNIISVCVAQLLVVLVIFVLMVVCPHVFQLVKVFSVFLFDCVLVFSYIIPSILFLQISKSQIFRFCSKSINTTPASIKQKVSKN